MGSSRTDLLEFPEAVKDKLGVALSVAQFGGKHPGAKPWRGEGRRVLEIVSIVLHVFQKKSPRGRKTAVKDVELISRRLKAASQDYEVRYGNQSK